MLTPRQPSQGQSSGNTELASTFCCYEATTCDTPLAAQPAHSGAPACDSAMQKAWTVGHVCMIAEEKAHLVFHAELALALRSAPQLARVPEHIIQRHFRHGRKLVLADLAINNSPTARIQPADHRA